jgi:4-amino-4-deoxy-L-arabinose transferase-like glycosyltransferase
MGLGLRLAKLGNAGLAFDESFHAVAAQSLVETGEPNLPSGKPYTRAMLFTKMVALSFSFFGVNEFAARLPSALFGTLSVVLVFLIARKFFGTPVGLLSALFLALSPFQIAWSRECRMYSAFQFLYLFGFYSFYAGFEGFSNSSGKKIGLPSNWAISRLLDRWNMDLRWLVCAAFIFFISYSLQRLTAFFGISVFVYCLFFGVAAYFKEQKGGVVKSKYFWTLLTIIVGAAIVLILDPSFVQRIKHMLFFSPNWASARKSMPLLYADFLASGPLFPIGVLFILGSVQIMTRASKTGIYTLVCILVPLGIISLFYSELRGNRYIFNIFALIIMIASYALYNFFDSEAKRLSDLCNTFDWSRYKKIATGVLVGIVLLAFSTSFVLYGYRVIIDYYGKEGPLALEHNDWKKAHSYVSRLSTDKDILITTNPLAAHFYQFDNIEYMLAKKADDYHLFDLKHIPDLKTLTSILLENPRGWIVTDPDRFISNAHTEKEVRTFIQTRLVKHRTPSKMRLLIFSWDRSLDPVIN